MLYLSFKQNPVSFNPKKEAEKPFLILNFLVLFFTGEATNIFFPLDVKDKASSIFAKSILILFGIFAAGDEGADFVGLNWST